MARGGRARRRAGTRARGGRARRAGRRCLVRHPNRERRLRDGRDIRATGDGGRPDPAGRAAPHVPDGTGAARPRDPGPVRQRLPDPARRLVGDGGRPSHAEHAGRGALADHAGVRRSGGGPLSQRPLRGHAVRLEDDLGHARPPSLVPGVGRVRPAGPRGGGEGRAAGRRPARGEGDAAHRLLRLCGAGAVLRRAWAGHPGERRGSGGRGHPDHVRPDRAERGGRFLGQRGHPARADPPGLQHRRPKPVPLPAALAQRGPGRLSLGGVHAVLA